ncbi:PRC-barrel domain-containing protein [Allorhizobium pseudoryzae]|uniref:PRC-barrel domain-containing protein n=1 Tax=Allorhizobium pseudoryzae TaxID=379684 RepID=UPI003CFE4598
MKKTFGTLAAAAVLMASTAAAPALAQTSTTNPATPAAPSAQTDTMKPNATGSMNSTTRASGTMGTTDSASTTGAASGEYLTMQSETQVSANDYIGKAIYNGENNSIGDVNDLILEENGGIAAVVVGVGGFLGIGEKNVALPMSKVNMTRDDNNQVRLTTTETAEMLKSAPEFKTLDDQASMDGTTTSSTTAPAAGGATAPATTTRP